jgi:hypothetical protein
MFGRRNVMAFMVLTRCSFSLLTAALLFVPTQGAGQCPGACPPFTPPTGPNLLLNSGFDNVGPCVSTWYLNGSGNCGVNSSAANWNIHSDNYGNLISTSLVSPTTLPQAIGGKFRMLHVQARGAESGVYQSLPVGLTKVVASVWVYVNYGHVVLQANSGPGGPSSWSTKTQEWEQLRICTDGSTPVERLVVWNEDPHGADFYIETAELQAVP